MSDHKFKPLLLDVELLNRALRELEGGSPLEKGGNGYSQWVSSDSIYLAFLVANLRSLTALSLPPIDLDSPLFRLYERVFVSASRAQPASSPVELQSLTTRWTGSVRRSEFDTRCGVLPSLQELGIIGAIPSPVLHGLAPDQLSCLSLKIGKYRLRSEVIVQLLTRFVQLEKLMYGENDGGPFDRDPEAVGLALQMRSGTLRALGLDIRANASFLHDGEGFLLPFTKLQHLSFRGCFLPVLEGVRGLPLRDLLPA